MRNSWVPTHGGTTVSQSSGHYSQYLWPCEDSQPIVFSLGYRENSSYFAFFMDCFEDDSLRMKVCQSSIHNEVDSPNKENPDSISDFFFKLCLCHVCIARGRHQVSSSIIVCLPQFLRQGLSLNLQVLGHFPAGPKDSPVLPPGLRFLYGFFMQVWEPELSSTQTQDLLYLLIYLLGSLKSIFKLSFQDYPLYCTGLRREMFQG